MRTSKSSEAASVIDAALEAMSAEELRDVIRELLPWLDDATHARLTNELIDRAARIPSGWRPNAPDDRRIVEIESFAVTAKEAGYADPAEVDGYLREGSNAFLARDYPAAFRIFRALLIPIGNADIDLGQHELVDEVLGIDVQTCATQYVVAMYMTASPKNHGKAVLSAIDDMDGVGYFSEPLGELERVVVEPLPDFDDFLNQWRELVEKRVAAARKSDWDRKEDRWLREVVARQEGPAGLGELARRSRRADDLRAWCRSLVDSGDWIAALAAYEQAAELVDDRVWARGEFLDGAALATQELNSGDLDQCLEQAWREAPTLLRLQRWLGTAETDGLLRERAAVALAACPPEAGLQRAFLHILSGDLEPAAELLVGAPGLGWSEPEHPGHIVFPVFMRLLGESDFTIEIRRTPGDYPSLPGDTRPRLHAPEIGDLLTRANVAQPSVFSARAAMIRAMRMAAEKRIEGVTAKKRRRYYAHAAMLALACARVDATPEGRAWLASLRDEYRRYPALQREFESGRS